MGPWRAYNSALSGYVPFYASSFVENGTAISSKYQAKISLLEQAIHRAVLLVTSISSIHKERRNGNSNVYSNSNYKFSIQRHLDEVGTRTGKPSYGFLFPMSLHEDLMVFNKSSITTSTLTNVKVTSISFDVGGDRLVGTGGMYRGQLSVGHSMDIHANGGYSFQLILRPEHYQHQYILDSQARQIFLILRYPMPPTAGR